MILQQDTLIGKDIELARQLLASGKLVAIPTETVYGLAANMFSVIGVRQIFEVKQRPPSNPLIVHLRDRNSISEVVTRLPVEAETLLEAFAPGPLTLLLPKKASVPDLVTAGLSHVAIRFPAHQLAIELLNRLDFPLVAPSANPYTYISPTSAKHVKKMLYGKIPYILNGGPCKAGIESTIIGFPNGVPTMYRLGAITIEEIEDKIGKIKYASEQSAIAPGMNSKHYSPKTKLITSNNLEHDIGTYGSQKIGLLTYNHYTPLLPYKDQIKLCENDDFITAGKNLYAALHKMDNKRYHLIIARKFPEIGMGVSINDRLNRAKI